MMPTKPKPCEYKKRAKEEWERVSREAADFDMFLHSKRLIPRMLDPLEKDGYRLDIDDVATLAGIDEIDLRYVLTGERRG